MIVDAFLLKPLNKGGITSWHEVHVFLDDAEPLGLQDIVDDVDGIVARSFQVVLLE